MKKLFLILILALGLFLRTWQLNDLPYGLSWDEAGIGYNAFSIAKTGRDEHGSFMPLIFKSFGDYKPGLYIYLVVPFVSLLGLTETAVRLPSALLGTFSIFLIYLFVNQLFDQQKQRLGLFAALALAIQPWHIHFSRGAWEVNLFTTLLLLGSYFLIRFKDGKSHLWPSLLFLLLSLSAYQGAKLLGPLTYLAIFLIYRRDYLKPGFLAKQKTINLILVVVIVGALFFSVYGEAGNRLKHLSIFSYQPPIYQEDSPFHNNLSLLGKMISSRYLYHFSPEVLFYEGTITTFLGHLPRMGMLNHLEFIWLLAGLFYLAQNPKPSSRTVLAMLLLAPLPSALSLSEFSTIRALPISIPLAIISGLGIGYLFSGKRLLLALPMGFAYLIVAALCFNLYFYHSQPVFYKEFNGAYKDAMNQIKSEKVDKVVVTDVFGQPYIYYLFYSQFDPSAYQANNDFRSGGVDVGSVLRVSNLEFRQFNQGEIASSKNTIFVGTEGNIPNNALFTNLVGNLEPIKTPDGETVLKIAKTKP